MPVLRVMRRFILLVSFPFPFACIWKGQPLTSCEDDSGLNCRHAAARGWQVAHLVEPELRTPKVPVSQYQIRDLDELRTCFPDLFKKS